MSFSSPVIGSVSVLLTLVKKTMDWPQCPGLTWSGRRWMRPPKSLH